MTAAATEILVVEDHEALRRGLEMLLRARGYAVIGGAHGVADGERMMRLRRPDVAVVDIGLEDGSGIDMTRRLLAGDPSTRIVLFTGAGDVRLLEDAMECGAHGLVLKSASSDELCTAIERVARGGDYFDPRLSPLLARGHRAEVLSPREREVLALLAEGLTGEEVAERLVISPQTVQTHVRNLMRKLNAKTRVHALALALHSGMLDVTPAGEPARALPVTAGARR